MPERGWKGCPPSSEGGLCWARPRPFHPSACLLRASSRLPFCMGRRRKARGSPAQRSGTDHSRSRGHPQRADCTLTGTRWGGRGPSPARPLRDTRRQEGRVQAITQQPPSPEPLVRVMATALPLWSLLSGEGDEGGTSMPGSRRWQHPSTTGNWVGGVQALGP